jgi:hypothetical protein
MWQEGTYSGGTPVVGPLHSDLCVPLGLGLPDYSVFQTEFEKDCDPCTITEISDKKLDDLFSRVALQSGSKKHITPRQRRNDGGEKKRKTTKR